MDESSTTGFNEIYKSCQLEYELCESILRGFSDCFPNSISNKKSNKLRKNKKNDVKQRRFSYNKKV